MKRQKKAYLTYMKTRGRSNDDKTFKALAKHEILVSDFALEMALFDTINSLFIKELPGEVNKAYSDFSPVKLGPDTLLFASIRSDSVITERYESEEVHPVRIFQMKSSQENLYFVLC